ncbi:hypothetical protein MMC19_006985 [Ptychographa xylographoides]|nr:hypothetical protein [Ptychographa xylographoides]
MSPPDPPKHFEDFLVNQLQSIADSDPQGLKETPEVRTAPLVEHLEFVRFNAAIVKNITPSSHVADLLGSLPEDLQSLYTEATIQPNQQNQQSQSEQTSNNMTLCEMSSLSQTEDLKPQQRRILADKMKDRDITLHFEHNKTYHTTQLVAFCLCISAYSSSPLTMLADFAIHDATRVISDLVCIEPSIFNIDQIGIFLRTIMLYVVQLELKKETLNMHLELECALSESGCLLIATYLINKLEVYKVGQSTDDIGRIASSISYIPVLALENIDERELTVSKMGTFENELQRMSNIIFHQKELCTTPEPWGWFLGILLEGAGQYVDYVNQHKKKQIERTSTVLAFGFAFAGLIPLADQFMGIVGLIADKVLHHFWQSDDYRPFIRRLDGLLQTKVVLTGELGTRTEPRLNRLKVLAAKQFCDDILNAKRRTQEMGAHVALHKKARGRLRQLMDRIHHRH